MKHLIRCTLIASGVVASAATLTVVANPGMSDYERWRATTQQEFQSYLDENDKAFIGFLKQRWEPVDTESGEEEDKAPKPTNIPKAPPIYSPVDAPEGTIALPTKPEAKKTSTSTVGLPRESSTSLALTSTILAIFSSIKLFLSNC